MSTSRRYRNATTELRWALSLTLALMTGICTLSPTYLFAATKERLAVLPFEIVDNTPVPGGEIHNEKMLSTLTSFVGRTIDEEGIYSVVSQDEVNEVVDAAQLGTDIHNCNRCEYDLALALDADKVMIGWIYKMSILILTMHIEVKDVASGKTLISKAYDFRGDNEKAWLRAGKYMVRDLGVMINH